MRTHHNIYPRYRESIYSRNRRFREAKEYELLAYVFHDDYREPYFVLNPNDEVDDILDDCEAYTDTITVLDGQWVLASWNDEHMYLAHAQSPEKYVAKATSELKKQWGSGKGEYEFDCYGIVFWWDNSRGTYRTPESLAEYLVDNFFEQEADGDSNEGQRLFQFKASGYQTAEEWLEENQDW